MSCSITNLRIKGLVSKSMNKRTEIKDSKVTTEWTLVDIKDISELKREKERDRNLTRWTYV